MEQVLFEKKNLGDGVIFFFIFYNYGPHTPQKKNMGSFTDWYDCVITHLAVLTIIWLFGWLFIEAFFPGNTFLFILFVIFTLCLLPVFWILLVHSVKNSKPRSTQHVRSMEVELSNNTSNP